jgi:Zn-dependent protease with chaperone function
MVKELEISSLVHPLENINFVLLGVINGLIWLTIIGGCITFKIWPLLIALPVIIFAFMFLQSEIFKAYVYTNFIEVNPLQHKELNEPIEEACLKLGISTKPNIFVYESAGSVNAFAVNFLSGQYVFLLSGLIDLMLQRDKKAQLNFVVNHELAHHKHKHTNIFIDIFFTPCTLISFAFPYIVLYILLLGIIILSSRLTDSLKAPEDTKYGIFGILIALIIMLIPALLIFLISQAHRRGQELTCDRTALVLTDNLEESQKALLSISSGSHHLADDIEVSAFKAQSGKVSPFFNFLQESFSSYPSILTRINSLEQYAGTNALINKDITSTDDHDSRDHISPVLRNL